MSSTGPITSWNVDLTKVGPIYPFVGWEVLMFALCVAFCLGFLIWKLRMENAKYVAKVRQLQEPGKLDQAMAENSPATLSATDNQSIH